MRFTLAVAIVLACSFHTSAAMADATRRPRALTVSSDATLVRTRSRVAYDDLTLVWGRVEGGERVMCASFVGGATSCHSPGLPRRRPARAKMAIGALLASGGIVTLGFGVALLRSPASLGGGAHRAPTSCRRLDHRVLLGGSARLRSTTVRRSAAGGP